MALFLVIPQSYSAMIINGDFANSCSFDSWDKDTDGGNVNGSDFIINGAFPNCTADIRIGDSNTSDAFSNTLLQKLDFTAEGSSTLILSMDFTLDSILTNLDSDFYPDILSIAFTDGSGDRFNANGLYGDIVNKDIDGFANFSFNIELDKSFINQTGWFLEFVLFDEFDKSGSTLSISNISLTEVLAPVTNVSEPTSLAIFTLGFAGLMSRRKFANELVRKSIKK